MEYRSGRITYRVVELFGLQSPGDIVSIEDDAGRKCLRVDELECVCRSSLRKEALPRAQQDGIDAQQDFIGKPMFEQRRCQRGASPEDKVGAAPRLDAANARDQVRSKALERAPFKTVRTVGSDKLCCRIDAVRHRTARRLWPEARPEIVGATAKQQIEPLALRGEDCVPASGCSLGRGPVAVGEIVVIGGVLDHAVQRDVFEDFELSHLIFTFAISGLGVNASPKSSRSITLRISTSASPSGEKAFGARFTHSIASSRDFA